MQKHEVTAVADVAEKAQAVDSFKHFKKPGKEQQQF